MRSTSSKSDAAKRQELEAVEDAKLIGHWHDAVDSAFVADPIAVVVYDYGKLIESEPQMTVFGPFGGWNEAREYRDRLPEEWRREAACVVMRDPSIWPDPKAAL